MTRAPTLYGTAEQGTKIEIIQGGSVIHTLTVEMPVVSGHILLLQSQGKIIG